MGFPAYLALFKVHQFSDQSWLSWTLKTFWAEKNILLKLVSSQPMGPVKARNEQHLGKMSASFPNISENAGVLTACWSPAIFWEASNLILGLWY